MCKNTIKSEGLLFKMDTNNAAKLIKKVEAREFACNAALFPNRQ